MYKIIVWKKRNKGINKIIDISGTAKFFSCTDLFSKKINDFY